MVSLIIKAPPDVTWVDEDRPGVPTDPTRILLGDWN